MSFRFGEDYITNCISTTDKVTSGNIYVAGRNITNLNGKELRINLEEKNWDLFFRILTV